MIVTRVCDEELRADGVAATAGHGHHAPVVVLLENRIQTILQHVYLARHKGLSASYLGTCVKYTHANGYIANLQFRMKFVVDVATPDAFTTLPGPCRYGMEPDPGTHTCADMKLRYVDAYMSAVCNTEARSRSAAG